MRRTKIFIVISSFFWSCVVSAVALWLPPQGVIDSSVLIFIAQLLLLVCTIIGVELPIIINRNGTDSSKDLA